MRPHHLQWRFVRWCGYRAVTSFTATSRRSWLETWHILSQSEFTCDLYLLTVALKVWPFWVQGDIGEGLVTQTQRRSMYEVVESKLGQGYCSWSSIAKQNFLAVVNNNWTTATLRREVKPLLANNCRGPLVGAVRVEDYVSLYEFSLKCSV